MFLPHLNAGNAPATATAPVDFVPGFDDIETAPPVDVMPEREPAPDFVPGFDDIEPEPVRDDWRTVPGRRVSSYNGNTYEFTLSNGTRRLVTVKRSEGMQHARDFLRSCWEPCKTEPIVYVPQPVPVDVDEIEPEPEPDETETDSRNAGWTFDEPDIFDGDF